MTPRSRESWWVRNRRGVVGLPLALLAALLASSERVPTYLWPSGLHAAQSSPQGEWLTFTDSFVADGADVTREVRVRVDEVGPAPAGWSDAALPPGTDAVQVRMSLSAAPDVPLSGCSLALRGGDGTRYGYLPASGSDQPFSPCVPADAPGPMLSFDGTTTPAGDGPRPGSWTVSPVVLVPEGVELTDVLLWWEMPDYAAISLG